MGMGLRIKNFNIIGIHKKVRFLWGILKNQYIGGLPKKWGFGEFADLRGSLAIKKGMVFLRGVDTPIHTIYLSLSLLYVFVYCLNYICIILSTPSSFPPLCVFILYYYLHQYYLKNLQPWSQCFATLQCFNTDLINYKYSEMWYLV